MKTMKETIIMKNNKVDLEEEEVVLIAKECRYYIFKINIMKQLIKNKYINLQNQQLLLLFLK